MIKKWPSLRVYKRTFSVMKLFLTAAAADLTASSSSAPIVIYHDRMYN